MWKCQNCKESAFSRVVSNLIAYRYGNFVLEKGASHSAQVLDTGSHHSFISSYQASKLKLPVIKRVALNIAPFGSQVVKGEFDVVTCHIHLGERVVCTKLVVQYTIT